MAQLLASKLRPPPLGAGWVYRPHLYERLAVFDTGVVLVCAPAGFGKSTLVVEWLTAQRRPMAWYSLDRYDSDVGLFGEYLGAAVMRLSGRKGGQVAVPGAQMVAPREMLAAVIDDLATAPAGSVVVLDDYHEVEGREVHEVVEYLAHHLPDGVALVVVTRTDPPLTLSRLRLRTRLHEIRGSELRFDTEQVAAYFRSTAGLELDSAQARVIVDRSEGWISALQLAAMSVPDGAPSALTDALSARHPHIAGYLVDEVLRRVPTRVAGFLQESSVLRRFDARLCADVTGSADAADLIDDLRQRNAFLVPLDGGDGWFRYHHLFADLLRSRLHAAAPGRYASLLQRATDECEKRGLTEDAITCALDAGNLRHAGSIVERTMGSALGRGEIARLRSWLRRFPVPAGPAEHAVTLGWAWCRIFEGDLAAATVLIDRIEADLVDAFAVEPRAQLAVMRAMVAFQSGTPAAAERHARGALAHLAARSPYLESLACLYIGRALHAQARRAEARPHLERAATLAVRGNTLAVISALFWLGVVDLDLGNIVDAERSMIRARQVGATPIATSGNAHPAVGIGDIGLAYVRLNQLETDEAVGLAERGTRLLERSEFIEMVFRAYFVWAEALSLTGRFHDAETAAGEGIAWLRGRRTAGGPLETWLLMARARNSWRRGRLDEADELLRRVRLRGLGSPSRDEALGFYEAADAVCTALRRADVEQSRRRLAELPDDPTVNVMFTIKRHVLTAALHEVEEDSRAAVDALCRAIELAHEGYRFQFSFAGPVIVPTLKRAIGRTAHDDFVRSVIRRLPSETAPAAAPPVEPLTDREVEVLREITVGHTNAEIAARLFISHGTVKRHVANIYRKLGAHHRAEAVARGRERGLVS